MPSVNLLMFPWDLVDDPFGPPQGIAVGREGFDDPLPPIEFPSDYNNLVCRVPALAAVGFFARVRAWTMAGNVRWFNTADDSTIQEGAFSVSAQAVRYGGAWDVPLANENELIFHGGWYGTAGASGGLGDCILRMWPSLYVPGYVDEMGRSDGGGTLGITLPPPQLRIQVGAPDQFIHAGKTTDADGCPLICTLPVTRGGSFDGYGITGFRFELGAPNPEAGGDEGQGVITGSATLTPTAWWPYDREDGDGPVYDAATGAHLRAPRG